MLSDADLESMTVPSLERAKVALEAATSSAPLI